jgi:dihydrofolate synthase/folylpolyglutamate synthase
MGTSPDQVRTRLAELEQFGIKLGLDNALALSQALGQPERHYPSVLIAGTNGKGSVAAMVTRALMAAGHRTGTYTSPHLISLTERVQVDGQPVSDELFNASLALVFTEMDRQVAMDRLGAPVTYFEATTAAAFECLRRSGIDVAVVEVGLGGRFDATNIVPQVAGAITSIGLDHAQQLGSTVEQVAFEKAGIIKSGGVTVLGPMDAPARSVIERVARERGGTLRLVEGSVEAQSVREGDNWSVSVSTPRSRYGPLRLALRGHHQVNNARVAVALLEELSPRVPVDREAIEKGLSSASWPGRLHPLAHADGRELLVDGAHNVDGAAALAAFLRDTGRAPLPLVLAVMKDKDATEMIRALMPVASRIVCTQLAMARSQAASVLASQVGAVGDVPCASEPDVARAVALAFDGQRRACAAGSLYLVGDLLAREASGRLW